jgi:proline iminopeptidase
MSSMDQTALEEIKHLEERGETENPRYMELLMEHHYVYHVLRRPPEQWPDPVTRAFNHINPAIYVPLQGPSELGWSGKLERWDRTADLANIEVPTLVIGAEHDTMDPSHADNGEDDARSGQGGPAVACGGAGGPLAGDRLVV